MSARPSPVRLLSTSAALLTALAVLAPTSALAAAEASPPASSPPPACTVGGIAVPEGEPIPDDIPTVISCFDSVAEAEQFLAAGAPGDYEQLQPDDGADRISARSASASTASTVIVGRNWTGTARSGSVLIHWGSGSGCYGTTFGFPSLAASWNNAIRSAEGFSNCWSTQYDGTSYTGALINCTAYCSTLGAMAARTSSIVYRPSGTFG
ncbi:hypothetical protein [Microbacterium sp. NPDC089695]|uniref:hypothetical protein n=1 Tax=Microbacterium sp. NPDC089695 TaxID=3364198 RepID=UPI0037F2E0D6